MTRLLIFVLLFVFYCDAKSIRRVSDKKVTKDTTGDLFPDWVPFKNKHGDELGEFKPVPKVKPKKRLALPTNFVLRAVAEPAADDDYDKGQGDSDNDDYYEKKEWSDLNRNAKKADPVKLVANGADTTDIEGIVNIIQSKPSPVVDSVLNENNNTANEDTSQSENKQEAEESEDSEKPNENTEKPENESPEEDEDTKINNKTEETKENDQPEKEAEAEAEEEEPRKSESQLSEDEKKETEEKKAKILSSVDALKERHAKEQRVISERVKEEELYEEEHERNRGKDSGESKEIYNERPSKWKKASEYDEYDGDISSVEDKYKIVPEITTTTTRKPSRKNSKKKKNKSAETGKLSVFKNPQLYIAYDDENEETTTTKRPTIPKPVTVSDSVAKPAEIENVRISLVPQETENKNGEPTLFYPKRRKNRRRPKTKTKPADSHVAETAAKTLETVTIAAVLPDLTAPDSIADVLPTAGDTAFSASYTAPSASDSSPIESDTAPSALDSSVSAPSAPDAVKSASDNQHASTNKEEHKPKDYSYERGIGRDTHSENSEEHHEGGKKAYEGVHKEIKKAKGHHDKEDHLGKYIDHGGVHKEHHDESGHYGSHHHEEHGKKHAKYEESGKHAKGHNTKGSHDIHKKEEYEKKVEFFEEEGDSAEEEGHGGHHHEKEHKSGGHFKKGDYHEDHHGKSKGDKGHFSKGGHENGHKGHHQAQGHDLHSKHGHGHHESAGQEGSKKWIFHKGTPGKGANLIFVDRRADQYVHGPRYFG